MFRRRPCWRRRTPRGENYPVRPRSGHPDGIAGKRRGAAGSCRRKELGERSSARGFRGDAEDFLGGSIDPADGIVGTGGQHRDRQLLEDRDQSRRGLLLGRGASRRLGRHAGDLRHALSLSTRPQEEDEEKRADHEERGRGDDARVQRVQQVAIVHLLPAEQDQRRVAEDEGGGGDVLLEAVDCGGCPRVDLRRIDRRFDRVDLREDRRAGRVGDQRRVDLPFPVEAKPAKQDLESKIGVGDGRLRPSLGGDNLEERVRVPRQFDLRRRRQPDEALPRVVVMRCAIIEEEGGAQDAEDRGDHEELDRDQTSKPKHVPSPGSRSARARRPPVQPLQRDRFCM